MCGQSSASSEWSRLKTPPLRKLLQDLMDVLLQARRPEEDGFNRIMSMIAQLREVFKYYGFGPCLFLFYLVEQLIIKHGVYDKVLKVSAEDDGINFYFKNTTHAQRLIDFLGSILPLTVKHSKPNLLSFFIRICPSNIFRVA